MEYQLHYKNISINFLNYYLFYYSLLFRWYNIIQYILITSFTALSLIKGYQYEYCIYVIKYGILSNYWTISQNKRKTCLITSCFCYVILIHSRSLTLNV